MAKVAKILIVDEHNNYLLLDRTNHPTFGQDPDIPGGTSKDGETFLDTVVREVKEEVGITIDQQQITELYSGADYSKVGTVYALFLVRFDEDVKVTLSWEHTAYSWLPQDKFLEAIKNAQDTYMHMVYDEVQKL